MIRIAMPLIADEEKQAVLAVLESGKLAQGAGVEEFEQAFAAYIGVKHAIAVNSGTAALHVALLAHGIGAGDEVITTPFTFIASANAVLFTGAKPVFADIDPVTFNLDPGQVAAKITPRTRALLPVHLYGQACDMDAFATLAREYHLALIEDACQAHGAEFRGQRVGSFGTGCFSFYPTKNMTTAEGGIITTNDDGIAERARLLRSHGARERYRHEILGYNYRMTDVQAAIGLAQLRKLETWNQQRIENARYLSEYLRGVVTPQTASQRRHVFHQYTIRVPDRRDQVRALLADAGIETAIHYPTPVHCQPLYVQMGYQNGIVEAERASAQVLSLPVHPSLTRTDLEQIVQAVNAL
jgi:dTDP-4-amino-4,6-dideoxygalactose transaminase